MFQTTRSCLFAIPSESSDGDLVLEMQGKREKRACKVMSIRIPFLLVCCCWVVGLLVVGLLVLLSTVGNERKSVRAAQTGPIRSQTIFFFVSPDRAKLSS